MIGETILHYKILKKLGEGGMGIVYLAEDNKLKRNVAIKLLQDSISLDEEGKQRFETEAQATALLNHPNISTIYSIEEKNNNLFIVMEYIEGRELKSLINKNSPEKSGQVIPSLQLDNIINYSVQIAEGLLSAHKKGIIHRDIKPSNIMISSDDKVKIMDFGLAKIKGKSHLTKIGLAIGTTAYMSPEQAKGEEIDERTDIFSFGIILYQLLTGHHPFHGEYDQAITYSILNLEPPTIQDYFSECPLFLSRIVEKCLAKDKNNRYHNFENIIYDLKSGQIKEQTAPGSNSNKEIKFTMNLILKKKDIFIGRDKQIKLLNKTLEEVKQGKGKTIFINGEPGIGKTQLISYIADNYLKSDFNILYGRCLFNNEGGLPYHPFVNAIKNNIAIEEIQFMDVISKTASLSGINISHRIPLIKNFLNLSADQPVSLLHKEQLWDAVFILFKIVAANKPLILILDDFLWADKSSIGLFSFIARNITNIPIALVGIHRPPETASGFDSGNFTELIRQLDIDELAENISLQRLNEKETDKVIFRLLNDKPVDKNINKKIFDQSMGNPLFIFELVNLLKDQGIIEFNNGIWKLKMSIEAEAVSKKVQDIIRQRIDYLDNKTKEILQIASCEGEYFQSDILSVILKIDRIELLRILQSLELKNQIIHHENKLYRFDHILIREVLYDSIIPELKDEYHKLIARWLIENYGSMDEYASRIAQHLISAKLEVQSIDYLLKAANRRRDLYAVEEALNYYNKLLTIFDKNGINDENYIIALNAGLGDVNISLGLFEDAIKNCQEYLNLARIRNDKLHIIKASRKLAECFRITGELNEAESICNDAIALAKKINNQNEMLGALNNLAFIFANKGEYNKTIEISKTALSIAEELKDQKNQSICLSNLGFAYWHLGNYPSATEFFNSSLTIQRSIGDNRGLSTTLNFLGLAYQKSGNYEEALECSEESVEIKRKISDYRKIPGSLNVIGDIYRDLGDIKKAIKYHKKSLKLATEHQNKGAMCDNIRDLGEDYFLNGELNESMEYYNKVMKLAIASDLRWYVTRTFISLSGLYLVLGDIIQAKLNIEKGLNYSYEIGAKELTIEALWTQAKIKTAENYSKESDKLFNEAIRIARSIGHQTFLWKLLYDYSRSLSVIGNYNKAKIKLNESKGIVLSISNNIKSDSLKRTFLRSNKVKEINENISSS